jgi:hypothetical protein
VFDLPMFVARADIGTLCSHGLQQLCEGTDIVICVGS